MLDGLFDDTGKMGLMGSYRKRVNEWGRLFRQFLKSVVGGHDSTDLDSHENVHASRELISLKESQQTWKDYKTSCISLPRMRGGMAKHSLVFETSHLMIQMALQSANFLPMHDILEVHLEHFERSLFYLTQLPSHTVLPLRPFKRSFPLPRATPPSESHLRRD